MIDNQACILLHTHEGDLSLPSYFHSIQDAQDKIREELLILMECKDMDELADNFQDGYDYSYDDGFMRVHCKSRHDNYDWAIFTKDELKPLRIIDPDREKAVIWSINDVQGADFRPDLDDCQAKAVIDYAERLFGAIANLTLKNVADMLYPLNK